MGNPAQYRAIIRAMHRLDLLRRISIHDSSAGAALHRTQMAMLEYIAAHEGCTQADVAKHMCVSAASIACSAKRMESAGLIARQADAGNLRCNRLSATEAGIARLAQMRSLFNAMDGRTFAGFTDEELNALQAMLERMVHNADRGGDAQKTMFALLSELSKKEEEEK